MSDFSIALNDAITIDNIISPAGQVFIGYRRSTNIGMVREVDWDNMKKDFPTTNKLDHDDMKRDFRELL